jgi:hypothetical protein
MGVEKRNGVLEKPDQEPVRVQILDLGEEDLREDGATPDHDKVEIIYDSNKQCRNLDISKNLPYS